MLLKIYVESLGFSSQFLIKWLSVFEIDNEPFEFYAQSVPV